MLGGVNTERYHLDFLHLYSPALVSVSLEEENHSRQRRVSVTTCPKSGLKLNAV